MASNERRKRRYQEKYASMSAEELRVLLYNHSMGTLGRKISTEELFYIIALFNEKRPKDPREKTPEEALESFHTHYLGSTEVPEEQAYREKPNWIRISLRAAAAMAAVVAVFFCVTITASAFGLNLFGFTPWWDQEQFIFQPDDSDIAFNAPISSDSIPYVELEMLLADHGIMANLTPQWIPEGYVFESITEYTEDGQYIFSAYHVRGDETLRLTIESLGINTPIFEKDSTPVQLYTTDGVDYYFFSNNERLVATGVKDSFLIIITGPITPEEMEKMLDSIEPLQ